MNDDALGTADRNSVIDAGPDIYGHAIDRTDEGQQLPDAAAQIGTADLILVPIMDLRILVDASALIGGQAHAVDDAAQFLVSGLAHTVGIDTTFGGPAGIGDSLSEGVVVDGDGIHNILQSPTHSGNIIIIIIIVGSTYCLKHTTRRSMC